MLISISTQTFLINSRVYVLFTSKNNKQDDVYVLQNFLEVFLWQREIQDDLIA